jgi:hypothetical protein
MEKEEESAASTACAMRYWLRWNVAAARRTLPGNEELIMRAIGVGRNAGNFTAAIIASLLMAADGPGQSGQRQGRQQPSPQFAFTRIEPGSIPIPDGGIAGDVPGSCGDVTLTQSTDSTTITLGNSVACNDGVNTTQNGYARMFAIPPGPNFVVNCVDFGVEINTGGAYVVTVNIYTGTIPGPVSGLTLLGSQAVTVPAGSVAMPLKADFVGSNNSVSVPGGTNMVVEVLAPTRLPSEGGGGGAFAIASNALGQSAPSYIRAANCGVAAFTNLASLGFPLMHINMRVDGGPTVWTAVSVCNNTGLDASDLHMTFAGAGGTLLVAPAMIVAPGCPAPLIPSNSMITSTVDFDWGAACVPDGGTVTYLVRSATGPLSFVSGTWTSGGSGIGIVDPDCVVLTPISPGPASSGR